MEKSKKAKMKFSDYIRLSTLSIKARKKSTKNTIFGMAFGLIILVPMIFFAASFFLDLAKKFDDIKLASQIDIPLKNINDESESTPYEKREKHLGIQEGISAFYHYDQLIEVEGINDYILAEYATLNLNSRTKIKIGDKTAVTIGEETPSYNQDNVEKLKIIFPTLSTQYLFTAAELTDYKSMTNKSSPLLANYGNGFTESTMGKSEIVVSETLLKKWRIEKNAIFGKEISILYPSVKLGGFDWHYYKLDDDTIVGNPIANEENPENAETFQLYFCYKFKVVGIIKSDYYELPGKEEEAHIFVTAPSVYSSEGDNFSAINYTITLHKNEGSVLTFEKNMKDVIKLNQERGQMLFLQNYSNRFKPQKNENQEIIESELNHMILTLQFKEYARMESALPEIKSMLNDTYKNASQDFAQMIANGAYTSFSFLDIIGKILIISFSMIGGIVFFTNMLNLINTLRYSIQNRKNYIGVMRAIGAKSKVIPRLYIFEMLIIFFRTFIWVTIFSTLISFGIKFGLDKMFEQLSAIVSFKFNFVYFPIVLSGVFLLTAVIGTLFAVISSKVVAFQPILKTLFEEK